MNIQELIEKTGWSLVTKNGDQNKEIKGAYCGDLLSWVMGNGENGQAWITIQVHMNILAVAELREFSCIIIADRTEISPELLKKAEEEGIVLIRSEIPEFETCKKLVELGF